MPILLELHLLGLLPLFLKHEKAAVVFLGRASIGSDDVELIIAAAQLSNVILEHWSLDLSLVLDLRLPK